MRPLSKFMGGVDGWGWSLQVVPRDQAKLPAFLTLRFTGAPSFSRSAAGERLDEAQIVTRTELAERIRELCQVVGIKLLARQPAANHEIENGRSGEMGKELDLADITAEQIIEAKQVRLDEINEQIIGLGDEQAEITRVIEALGGGALVKKPKKAKRQTATRPGPPPTEDAVLNVLRSGPEKNWVVRYLADALGTRDEDAVRAIVGGLIASGKAERGERGRFRLVA